MMSLLEREKKKFFAANPEIEKRTLFLTYGGSHAWGTNIEGSDVDLRGLALPSKIDILALRDFEEIRHLDKSTDSDICIYSLRKGIDLLSGCHPNAIELLGGKPEFYTSVSPAGKRLLESQTLFLSKTAAKTFSGYARGQLIRLTNALARNTGDNVLRDKAFSSSIARTLAGASEHSPNIPATGIRVYKPETGRSGVDEILADINLTGVPIKELSSVMNQLTKTIDTYSKRTPPNMQRNDIPLNKDATQLVRILLTGIDILRDGKIIAFREKDHELLMDIRLGKYRLANGLFSAVFMELLEHLFDELAIAEATSPLPAKADRESINKLEQSIMEEYLYAQH